MRKIGFPKRKPFKKDCGFNMGQVPTEARSRLVIVFDVFFHGWNRVMVIAALFGFTCATSSGRGIIRGR